MSAYTRYFERAAEIVESQDHHPGQSIPGYWNITDAVNESTIVGVIIGRALMDVATELEVKFDPLITRFMAVTAGAPMEFVGDPAAVAAHRLKTAAQLNLEATETAIERLVRLAGQAVPMIETFAHSSAATVEGHKVAKELVGDIRVALSDFRASVAA